jgi:hypothetical protein
MEPRDQHHDPAFAVLHLLLKANPEAEEFVKHADLDETKVAELPDRMFAWPARRLFPINTPEATVLSSMYRQKCAAVPSEVDDSLRRAQEVYGVKDLLSTVKTAEAPPPITEDDFLLPQHKRLLVKTAADVKKAEEILLDQYPRLNIQDRATGFINLVKKARDFNVSLAPKTHQMAGMTVCTTKRAMDLIEARRCATKDPLFQTAYVKLAAVLQGRAETLHDREELIELAEAVARIDKLAGLGKHYDKLMPDPIQTVFNTEKLAEEMVDLNGREVALSKLAAMPATFWEDVIGPDMAAEITTGGDIDASKLAQIVPTLPLDLRIILQHQIP